MGANSQQKIICAMDEYIANGGQGYDLIKNKSKKDTELTIDNALKNALTVTALKYPKNSLYPQYEIYERVVE